MSVTSPCSMKSLGQNNETCGRCHWESWMVQGLHWANDLNSYAGIGWVDWNRGIRVVQNRRVTAKNPNHHHPQPSKTLVWIETFLNRWHEPKRSIRWAHRASCSGIISRCNAPPLEKEPEQSGRSKYQKMNLSRRGRQRRRSINKLEIDFFEQGTISRDILRLFCTVTN